MNTTGQPPKPFTILICTAKRPVLLKDLLYSIDRCYQRDPIFELKIVVVDNDPEKSAEHVIKSLDINPGISLAYYHEKVMNISRARNLAVRKTVTDWCLFLDDDQIIKQDFFQKLGELFALLPNDTAGVRLAVEYHIEIDVPDWLRLGLIGDQATTGHARLHLSPLTRNQMGTGGLLFQRKILMDNDLRFNEDLGLSGGEDVELYLRAQSQGKIFLYSATPTVTERIPKHRATFGYGLRSSYRKGYIDAKLLYSQKNLYLSTLYLLQSCAYFAVTALIAIMTIFLRPKRCYVSLLQVWRQVGKFAATVMPTLPYYATKSRSYNVLHLTGGGQDGGAEKIIEQMAIHLQNPAINLRFFFYDTSGLRSFSKQIVSRGFPTFTHKKSAGFDWKLWWKLSKVVRSEKIDIIHTHDLGAMFHAWIIKKRHPKIKLIHTEHTLHYWAQTPKYQKLYKLLAKSFCYIACVSDYVRNVLVTSVHVDARKLVVVPNGVDIDLFRPSSCNHRPMSSNLHLVSVSRIDSNKNISRLIQGMALARKRGFDITLTHVGSGEEKYLLELKHLIDRLEIKRYVNLAGYSNDVATWIHQGDIFVSASKVECHPVSVLEAMAAGKPCVLSDIEPHRELTQIGVRLFHDTDESFANALIAMAMDVSQFAFFAQKLQETAAEKYSIYAMLTRYSELYSAN